MSIRFTCPHCQKPLSVKDHLAGKNAACPVCKKPVTIPGTPSGSTPPPPTRSTPPPPTRPSPPPAAKSNPAPPKNPPSNGPVAPPPPIHDADALAAELFADEPKPEPVASTKTVDFTCPQCDALLHLSADLAGKRTPCPECKRIIQVPQLKKEEAKDWRKIDTRLPAGARRDLEPAPEGAWGSAASAANVSRQALLDADVLPQRKVVLTTGQKVKRYVSLSVFALVVAGGVFWWLNRRSENEQAQLVARALEQAPKLNPEAAAELHRAAGAFHLRLKTREDKDEAVKEFRAARGLLAQAAPSRDRDLALMDLALTQSELLGDKESVDHGLLLNDNDATKEIQQTLANLPAEDGTPNPDLPRPAGPRVLVLRVILQQWTAKGRTKEALGLARVALSDATTREGLAQIGFDLLGADKAAAETLADEFVQALQGGQDESLTPSAIALCIATNKQADLADFLKQNADHPAVIVGILLGNVVKGNPDRTRLSNAGLPPELRFHGYVLLAANQAPDAAKADLEQAARLIDEIKPATKLAPSLLYQWAQIAAKAGLSDLVQQVASKVADPKLRGMMQLEVFRAKLAQTKDKADDALADAVEKPSLAHLLAREGLARHNVRRDSGTIKTVGAWDELAQPFGMAGCALGLQDAQ
jgi:hypothetical protein